MILMYLFLLVLIFAEVLDESVNLDLHDARSQFKLVLVFITAELIGLIAGINYGFLICCLDIHLSKIGFTWAVHPGGINLLKKYRCPFYWV